MSCCSRRQESEKFFFYSHSHFCEYFCYMWSGIVIFLRPDLFFSSALFNFAWFISSIHLHFHCFFALLCTNSETKINQNYWPCCDDELSASSLNDHRNNIAHRPPGFVCMHRSMKNDNLCSIHSSSFYSPSATVL